MLRGHSPARFLLIGFVLLAFVLQSYATQTHIHFESAPTTITKSIVAKIVAAPSGHAGKPAQPDDNNPDNCPLCQMFYGGQYVAPSALVFFLPMVAVSVIEAVAGVMPHYDAASHSWRGRAPPSA